MTVSYSIQNCTSYSVKTVMLRKFFQMVFVSDDKKSLHIYTAVILGASNGEISEEFVSDLALLKDFRMRFEFAVSPNDDNEVLNIVQQDITDGEHGFLNEVNCVKNIWGDKCQVLKDNQLDIIDKLKRKNGEVLDPVSDDIQQKCAALVKRKMLWTEQKKSGVDEDFLQSLSVAGDYAGAKHEIPSGARDEVNARYTYTVGVPSDVDLPKGVELLNWTKTTIQFKYKIDEKNLNYVIKKPFPSEEGRYDILAPDFTWYFAPPVKSLIDNRNSIVEIKRGTEKGEDYCTCPLQDKKRMFYTSDKFENTINMVPNRLTVNFHFWDKDENIKARQKYRLAARDILPRPSSLSEISEISIFLDMTDEHSRGNSQFMAGLFISFMLSYGIDSSRLETIESFFSPLTRVFPSDVWWISFLLMTTLTLLNYPTPLLKHSRVLSGIRWVLLGISALWTGFTFAIARSPLFMTRLDCTLVHNIAGWMLAGTLVLHGVYLLCIRVNRYDSVWIKLLGKDAL